MRVRRNKAGDETRAALLESAVSVIVDHGITGLTLQEVARRAGIGYGNLTHHYPSREALLTAVLDALEAEYLERFKLFALSMTEEGESPVARLLVWLLDDAVSMQTAGIFLELWACSTRDPSIARRAHCLYDEAVEACISALGVAPESEAAQPLREALYLLGTVVEGSSALFAIQTRDPALYAAFRRDAAAILTPFIEQRLEAARREQDGAIGRAG